MQCPAHARALAAIDRAATALFIDPVPLRQLFAVLHVMHTVMGGPHAALDFALQVATRADRLSDGLHQNLPAEPPVDLIAALGIIDLITPGVDGGPEAQALATGYLKVLIARDADVADVYVATAVETYVAERRLPWPSPFLLVGPLLAEGAA